MMPRRRDAAAAPLRGPGPGLGRCTASTSCTRPAPTPPGSPPTSARPCRSAATTAEALRAEGVYRILTPAQCVELAASAPAEASLVLHPLCGGMPLDEGWRSLRLLTAQVLPALKD